MRSESIHYVGPKKKWTLKLDWVICPYLCNKAEKKKDAQIAKEEI